MGIESKLNSPIVRYIGIELKSKFSLINRIGGYNNRTTETGSYSFHSDGLAMDIYLNTSNPSEKQLGDLLFDMFINNYDALSIHHAIWNGQIWSKPRKNLGKRPLGAKRNQHTDHIHVAFLRRGRNSKPPELHQFLEVVKINM